MRIEPPLPGKISWSGRRLVYTLIAPPQYDRTYSKVVQSSPRSDCLPFRSHRMHSRDQYDYGWNQRGQRFLALKSGRREGRVNMIAALCNQNLIAPLTIEGACNRTVFKTKAGKLFAFHTQNRTGCGDG